MEFTEKVAIVTGASRRIGAAIAVGLGARGAAVVINYLNRKDEAEKVAARFEAAGGRALIHSADVRDRAAVKGMVDEAVSTFGGVDILVNNARTPHPVLPILEMDWERDMLSQMQIHLGGAFHCCQEAIPHMKSRGGGENTSMKISASPPRLESTTLRAPPLSDSSRARAAIARSSPASIEPDDSSPSSTTSLRPLRDSGPSATQSAAGRRIASARFRSRQVAPSW